MRIISGGQCGVELGALQGTANYNIQHIDSGVSIGGYVPKGWMTETGPQKDMLKEYGLKEDIHPIPGFDRWKSRDIKNIDKSDLVVIIFLSQQKDDRLERAAWYALHGEYKSERLLKSDTKFFEIHEGGKPVIFVWELNQDTLSKVSSFISKTIHRLSPKNVLFKGSRESFFPGAQNITQELIYDVLCRVYWKE